MVAFPDGATSAGALEAQGALFSDRCEIEAVLAELCPPRGNSKPSSKSLARRLRALEGRVRSIDGREVRLVRVAGSGAPRWRVEEVAK